MPQHSAGILLYRRRGAGIEVLLVHPGGPFWSGKDAGAWSIPKGIVAPGEGPLAAARREFTEETGGEALGEALALGAFRQSTAKIVEVWAVEGEFDPANLRSNTFTLEWPPRSGRTRAFPEADRAAWFAPDEAARKLIKGQRPVLDALLRELGPDRGSER
jgi:predicted NUDIX family NTP pyrophosphohydrolase